MSVYLRLKSQTYARASGSTGLKSQTYAIERLRARPGGPFTSGPSTESHGSVSVLGNLVSGKGWGVAAPALSHSISEEEIDQDPTGLDQRPLRTEG